MKPPFFHLRDKDGGGISFPLDETHGSCRWDGEIDSEVETPDSSEEANSVEGRCSQAIQATTSERYRNRSPI